MALGFKRRGSFSFNTTVQGPSMQTWSQRLSTCIRHCSFTRVLVMLLLLGTTQPARADDPPCGEPLTPSYPCVDCRLAPIGGAGIFYCPPTTAVETLSYNYDRSGGVDIADIKEFIWEAIACSPPGAASNLDAIIDLIC